LGKAEEEARKLKQTKKNLKGEAKLSTSPGLQQGVQSVRKSNASARVNLQGGDRKKVLK